MELYFITYVKKPVRINSDGGGENEKEQLAQFYAYLF